MDITHKFKAIVDEVENNHYKMQDGHNSEELMLPDKNRILPKARRKKSKKMLGDPFEIRAKDIVDNITRLREFLAENRSAYIDVLNITANVAIHTGSTDLYNPSINNNGLTDLERDKIDAGANGFVRKTNQLIAKFKSELKQNLDNKAAFKLTGHQIQHLEVVCDILDSYLRTACQSHAKQKAIRVEKELEFQKLSRLELSVKSCQGTNQDPRSIKTNTDFLQYSEMNDQSPDSSSDLDHGLKRKAGEIMGETKKLGQNANEVKLHKKSKKLNNSNGSNYPNTEKVIGNAGLTPNGVLQVPKSQNNLGSGYQYSSDDDAEMRNDMEINLSPEEIQAYEQENEAMYDDLVSLRDNVEQIENKVVKIAQLQEAFTEKVLQQKDDIDLIANHAVSATENMTDANEELRKAIQRNASMRVYILFFLLVMSFTLIFLDWYND